jgi:hypothetical protein
VVAVDLRPLARVAQVVVEQAARLTQTQLLVRPIPEAVAAVVAVVVETAVTAVPASS